MRDILREIYANELFAQPGPGPEYYRQRKKLEQLWEQAEAQIGRKLGEELHAAESEAAFEDNLECFKAGFRLGAQLILELL